ncbi:uncharacterized protein [Ptychodera flava]|uniref:uncharacterized protein n=1 Tax=Ptychodera flava TaxID=63121 RepID=UPI00396A85E5
MDGNYSNDVDMLSLTSSTDEEELLLDGFEYKYFPANNPEALNERIRHCVKFYRDIVIGNNHQFSATEPEVPQLEVQQTPNPKRKKVISPDEIFNELKRSYQRGVVIPEILEPPIITNSFEEFKIGFKNFYHGFRARDQRKLQDNYLYGQWLEKAFVHFSEKKKKKENFIDWVEENYMAVEGKVVLTLAISLLSHNVAAFSLDKILPAEAVQRYAKAAGLDEGGEYDVVYPKFSQRRKREAAVNDDDVEDHITVTAFGETYNLRLKRSDDFFVTPFVEYCGDGGIRLDRFPVDVDKSCYHSGYITGVENSLVAVKSCNGDDVTGWLIGDYTLFLHPLKSEDLPARLRRDIDGHPHIALLVHENPMEEFLQHDVLVPKGEAGERHRKRSAQNERETRGMENSRPTYIELMVTVDKTAQEKLGDNTIPHVLAMVNMVATAYRHPSSEDMNFNVRLVRLILIDDDKCKPFLNISDDVYDRLSFFAAWADTINVADEDSPLHFDYGFLITQKDWINSDVGGLAYRGAMCGYYSVGLCPISTYVSCFGHEMSHSLGLNHELTACPESTDKGFHSGGYYKFTECNRNELKDYMIQYRHPSSCLYDEPLPQTTFPWPGYGKTEKVISGEVFTPDMQCKGYYYGKSKGQCPWKTLEVQDFKNGEECYMYCEMTDGSCEYWGKAIEGTPCGHGKSCLAEICTCVDQASCSSTDIGSRPNNVNYVPSVFEADRDTAVQVCNSQQGSLVKILNKDTYDHLIGVISNHHQRNDRFHFDGRRYPDKGNDWRTFDGEKLTFFKWESKEPNNAGGNQECLYLWEGLMEFSDYPCSSYGHYVCQKDGKGECFTEALANDYRGMKSTTKQGYTCLKWTEHSYPKTPKAFPNRGLGDHNYCRNPDVDSGGAWCYIFGGSIHYDYCDVGQPQQTCGGKDECYQDANGYDYRGKRSKTISGYTCQKWTSQTPRQHNRIPENYPNRGLGDHNYCRNPDNEKDPWCYTVDGPRWEYCDVGRPGDCEKLGQNMHGKMVRLGETSTLVSTKPFSDSIYEITVSFWVRSSGRDYGVPFVYSSPSIEDDFSVRNIGYMQMYVHGIEGEASSCSANDGFWRHVTVTWQSASGGWQFFKDGVQMATGSDLAKGFQIEAGGIMVIGRGQDKVGDAWSSGYIEGEMTNFNAWNRKLTAEEIQNLARACDSSMTGNLISWISDDLGVQLSVPGSLPIEDADTCEPVVSGLEGKMIMFDGEFTIETSTTIPKLTQLTACFWLQSTYSNGGWFTYQTQGKYAMALWYDTELMVQNSNWNGVSTTVNDGNWHHVCVTWKSSGGEWQVFKDGVRATNGAGHGDGFELAAGGKFILGTSRQYEVKGNMAFFNVWDRVLTNEEVTGVKNACDGNYIGNVLSWKRGVKPPPGQYTEHVNLCAQ